ncbi:MAG: hypothetical protein O3A00_24890, partial [Planctomycetota bacterium]|nr:hypothetical protein [Planctomycetota bacterium]
MSRLHEIPLRPNSPDELRQIARNLRDALPALRSIGPADTFTLLQRLGAEWQPGTPYFNEARKLLDGTFSPVAIDAALKNLAWSLTGNNLQAELARELGRSDLLETWQVDESHTGLVRGFPLGVVAQVLAGNVFLNGIIGVAQCLLTRNAALLKTSSRDCGLTALFVKSLFECDASGVLQQAIAVCSWPGEADDFNQILREESDAIVVWGGAAAVAAYSADRCRGKVIHHGPRLGIGVVLDGIKQDVVLSHLAWDVALWEQQACSSPRIVFVEDRDASLDFPRRIAAGLDLALAKVSDRLTVRELTLDEKAEARSVRELSEWRDSAELFSPRNSMSHTVLVLNELPTEIPVGFRTVLVVPLRNIVAIPTVLAKYRDVLQTVVLAANPTHWPAAVERLAEAGITQIAAPGSAASRFLGLPHEGEFSLRRLVKLVGVDLGGGPLCDPDRQPDQTEPIADALAGL